MASSLEYPQRNRVVSVFEFFVCLFFVCSIVNFLFFSSFILLFLYSTVQKSAVQYSYLFIKQAGADITGQLQVRPMVYIYIHIHIHIHSHIHIHIHIHMDMDMDIDVYHRPNLERACNVGCRFLIVRL